MQLNFELAISDNAWYPTAELTHFTLPDGTTADIKERLSLFFTGPGKVSVGDINVETNPWKALDVSVEQTEVGSGQFDTRVTVTAPQGDTLGNAVQRVHIGLNRTSDQTAEWSTFRSSFVAAADEQPNINGTLTMVCAAAPAGLENCPPVLLLRHGDNVLELEAAFGQSSSVELPMGLYSVTTGDLKTADGTRRAACHLSQQQLEIAQGGDCRLQLTFGSVVRSTTLNVTLDLSAFPDLADEDVEVSYAENSAEKLRFMLKSGECQRLETLPESGKFTLSVTPLRLNNQQYRFTPISGSLDGQLHTAAFTRQQISVSNDDTAAAVSLTLVVKADQEPVRKSLSIRLVSANSATPRQYRLDAVPTQSGSYVATLLLAPGEYQPQSYTFFDDSTLYYVEMPQTLVLNAGAAASLQVNIERGANLLVKGFPQFLTFGGCANMSPGNVDDFAAARISSIFKYAGDDGMGDAGGYLDPAKEPTRQVIQMARDVSAKQSGESVLPVMVSYTCNLSLGDIEHILADPVRHKFSFANYIQALKIAQSMKDEEHPVPAGFIVNPDFLGECQKTGLGPDYFVPVCDALKAAMAYHQINLELPLSVDNTLSGYIHAVNWLTRVVAPDVVFGWQVNLWGVGGSQWVYNDFSYENAYNPRTQKMERTTFTPEIAGRKTAEYAQLMGVFDLLGYVRENGLPAMAKGADFMAVDRYEADDFTIRSWSNGYCYSPFEWDRTFAFCAAVSRQLRMPVLPWQVPASHLATTQDNVTAAFNEQNWGSGGSYILGHPEIADNLSAIHPTLLNMAFNPAFAGMMGNTPRELFGRHQWDLTAPRYVDFPSMGIFHVQLGGGATTGVVSAVGDSSNWVRNKLRAYRDAPVAFADKTKKS